MHQVREDPEGGPLTSPLRRAVIVLAFVAVFAVGATSCTGEAKKFVAPQSTSSSTSASSRSEDPQSSAADATWVGQGPRPLSNLVSAGGHIVYLGVDDDDLSLVGLDPTTGAVDWERPSSLGHHIPGVEVRLVVDGDHVFHLESGVAGTHSNVAFPPEAAAAQASGVDVVAVDAANGREVWRHRTETEPSTPMEACDGALCVNEAGEDGHLIINRLAFADGTVTSTGKLAFEPLVSSNLSRAISASRNTSEVVLTSDYGQQVVWRHTRAELFGTDAVTPDSGWAGDLVDGVWFTWLGGPGGLALGALALGVVSGISDAGQRLWSVPDATICPIFTAADARIVPVRCGRLDAVTQTYTMGTTERLDPATGRTVWSLDMGDVDAATPGDAIVRFDDGTYAVDLPSGAISLDIDWGPGGPPSTTSGWCISMADSLEFGGEQSAVASAWAPCTLGKGANHTPPATVPAFAGPTVAGYGAWVENGEVRAVRIR